VGYLSAASLRSYGDSGFLAIPGFFTEAEVATATDAYDGVCRDLPTDVVADSISTGRRARVKDMTESERCAPLKMNDLYLRDPSLRDTVLSARLGMILAELLTDDPVLVNTLSVEYGTEQPDHLDTLYMTPQSPGKLVASWMALEDVVDGAGPLRYYPESNHIEPYRFEDGGYHVRAEEMEQWSDYMADSVERRGLAETRFLAKRGDLFIWDAWLLHGGSEICMPGRSRRSVITHYYTRTDCATLGADLRPAEGGFWMRRSPQAVPGESPEVAAANNALPSAPDSSAPDSSAADLVLAAREPRELRERFADLDPVWH
jgi:phytanoyl-CoA hydroxylase